MEAGREEGPGSGDVEVQTTKGELGHDSLEVGDDALIPRVHSLGSKEEVRHAPLFDLREDRELEVHMGTEGADHVQPKEVEVVEGLDEVCLHRVEVEEHLPVPNLGEAAIGEVVGTDEGVPNGGWGTGRMTVAHSQAGRVSPDAVTMVEVVGASMFGMPEMR